MLDAADDAERLLITRIERIWADRGDDEAVTLAKIAATSMKVKVQLKTLNKGGPQGIAFARTYSTPVTLTVSILSGGGFGGNELACHAIVPDNKKGILNNDICIVRKQGPWNAADYEALEHREGP